MGWVTAAVSGVAATVGVTTLVLGLQSDASGDGPADVWIDGPLAEARLVPGEVTVSAHATAEARIEDLVLEVDGEEVADAEDVERNGKLVYATFSWQADEGEHVLVVTQEGGDGARSAERLVYVGDPLAPVPVKPKPKPEPSEKPSETPTPSETPSASETPSESVTPTEQPAPEPRPTQKPTTPKPEPEPAPIIDAASVARTGGGDPFIYLPGCGYSVTVQARVRNATSVKAIVEGTGRSFAMGSAGSSWSTTFSGAGFAPGDADAVHQVTIRATSSGGTVTAMAGSLTIKTSCPKD